MQTKTVTLLRMLLAASLSILIGNVSAEDSLSSFEQALKDTGWSVQREADGSLILEPQALTGGTQGNNTSTEDQWPQLQNKLRAAGWFVEREADGSLRLAPPETETHPEPKAAPPIMEPDEENSFQSMQQKLKDAGWGVSNSPDGSILLYPPGSSKPKASPGIAPTVDVMLPVDSWKKAHDITQGWLNEQSHFNATVGKIRKILNIYVVSIVSNTAPFNLIQQVAIRNSDGALIILN